jgi:hypothetical protein
LTEKIETGKFERGDDLRSVVVERRGRVRQHEAHLFEPRRIASHERWPQREDRGDG